MVNLVWTSIIKLADGNTAIRSWLALLCAGLLVVPRPTEWRHLLPFIITASSLFIISSSCHWTCLPWTTNMIMKAHSQGSKAPRRRGTGKNHSFYRLSRYPSLARTCASRQRSGVVTLVQRFLTLSQHWIAWVLVHGRRQWLVPATGKDIVFSNLIPPIRLPNILDSAIQKVTTK